MQCPNKNSCANVCVCWRGLLQMFLGNKPPVRGKVHENMPIPPSLSLFAFSVSATCRSPFAHPPYTTHHLFLGTLMSSYIWRSSGALRGGGKWTVDVCTACLIPEQRGQFTRAAQLLTFFFLFVSLTGQSPASTWRESLMHLSTFALWWIIVRWCGFKSLHASMRGD